MGVKDMGPPARLTSRQCRRSQYHRPGPATSAATMAVSSAAKPALVSLGFLALFWTTTVSWVSAFNLDTQFPLVLKGAYGSQFGYSVALHQGVNDVIQALVGAIRANSSLTSWQGIYEPGVLYRCHLLEEDLKCHELLVDRTGNDEQDLKDNMTLGLSLDVSRDGNVVVLRMSSGAVAVDVICVHFERPVRLCGKTKNGKNDPQAHVYNANGACYVLGRNLRQPKKLIPLIHPKHQHLKEGNNRYYYYYYYVAEMGFSAAFTEDGRLVLGTPGFRNWEGSVTRYSSSQKLISHHILLGGDEEFAYKGYSVTTGKLFDGQELTVAAGSPRGNDYKGQVFVFGIDARGDKRTTKSKDRLSGSQMCEYFGASVMAADLDGDGIDDLLVGAPMHTIPNGQDEGRVYVFRSNGTTAQRVVRAALFRLLSKKLNAAGHLEGRRAPAARFGTTIVKVGDLNLDGIQDVAIGAPYENDVGAVYIYHGSRTFSATAVYAQRIDARTVTSIVKSQLKGFGISISKGVDIDSNHYKDILIGSYITDTAVLFRSRPIAELRGDVSPEVEMITVDLRKCEVSGVQFSCFNLTACVEYSGEFVNDTAAVETKLTLDVDRGTEDRPARGFMFRNQTRVDKYSSTVRAAKGQKTCEGQLVYLDETFVDPLTPFTVRLEYRFSDTSDQRWCPTCPVPDKDFPLAVNKTIPYQHGCRSDDLCQADLKLNVDIVGYDGNPLVVGERRDLSLPLFVKNNDTADPAYMARVVVTLPGSVKVVNTGSCTVEDSKNKKFAIVCHAGNPLRHSRDASFLLKLDISHVEDTFNLTAEAATTSNETWPNDNKVMLTLPFIHQADIAMLGKATPQMITFSAATKTIQMEHTFILAKQYASPIQQVRMTIRSPYAFSESENPIAYVKQMKVEQGDGWVNGTCDVEGFIKPDEDDQANRNGKDDSGAILGGRVKRSATEKDSPHSERMISLLYQNIPSLNCTTFLCHEVSCNFGPFLTREKSARITLAIVVNIEEFIKQAGTWHAFSVGTEGYLEILDNTSFVNDPRYRKELRVATVFEKEGLPPAPKVAAWIIAVSVFSGLILFSLIIAGLNHLGFFRRRQREELEKLLRDEEENEWDEFAVTEADVEAEKEFFRESMMMGAVDPSALQEAEDSPKVAKELG